MAGDPQHIHDPATAEEFARDLGLQVGGAGHPFVGNWGTKGLYAYRSGQYKGMAYFGTGGSERDRLTMPHESEKYRPWNRYDPNIPDHIRKRLIELEDDDSTSIAQPSRPARAQPSVEPSSDDMLRGENILVSGHSIPKYNGIYAIQTNEINGKPWYKNNSGCMLYFYNANSGGGPSWSLDDRSQDGTNDWFRGGWIEPPNSGGPPLGTRRWAIFETHRRFEIKLESVSIPDEDSRRRNDGGRIALKSVHGKYLSAQPDGRAEWNRTVASDWEFFELSERDGRKITLRSAHGKYVSAQPDGTVQINRDHAPPGGWEEFTVETQPGPTPGDAHDALHLKSVHGFYLSAQADGTAQWNRVHAPPGGWEDIRFVPQGDAGQGAAHEPESIEMLEDASSKPAQMTEASTKNAAKFAFVVGIALFSMGLPLLIVGSISTGEGKLAMLVPGAVMSGIGAFLLMGIAISSLGSSLGKQETKDRLVWPLLEVLSFNHRQPVRFCITNPPEHNDAWVGLYPANAGDQDHGDRWHYLRDIDVNNASLPGQEQGAWSLRLFSDGRYTLDHRVDFELRASSKEEVWMREAEFGDQRLNGLIQDHRNNFTKKVTTSKIVAQHKVGNLNRFETDDTTYLVYDRDLERKLSEKDQFWDVS